MNSMLMNQKYSILRKGRVCSLNVHENALESAKIACIVCYEVTGKIEMLAELTDS